LVTGAAGFIGFHVARALLRRGHPVIGADNLNDYYDVGLKEARLQQLADLSAFSFRRVELADASAVDELFAEAGVCRVIHLAAQAGVRYSLENPASYVQSNLVAFANILEACRRHAVRHLVYASSSSVYGGSEKIPFSVADSVDHPYSLYAATKKANELMAHTYSHLFGLPTTGLRFFTVYGPWGRPDMATFIFTKAILEGRPIEVFNHGQMRRDFTYIDDIVEGVLRVAERVPTGDPAWSADSGPASSKAPYRLYNIGNNSPVELMRFIGVLETELGRKAKLNMLPIQPGDVPATCADVEDLSRDTGFSPDTPIEEGIARFVEWYREYYGVARVS
jgi:UDP-glucuronate 4-epimerase